MSWELGGKVLEDRSIKDARLFCVMLCLADATNKETGTCYPSLDRIATVSRTSRRTAIRAMEKLEALGWIEVIRRRDENGGTLANVYRVVKYLGGGVTMAPQGVSQGHSGECQTTGRGSAKSAKRGCHHGTPGGVTMAPKPVRREPGREPIRESLSSGDTELLGEEILKTMRKTKPKAALSKEKLIEELQKLYPNVNVSAAYPDACAWILLHPDRKFTQRFFAGWVAKESRKTSDAILPIETPSRHRFNCPLETPQD